MLLGAWACLVASPSSASGRLPSQSCSPCYAGLHGPHVRSAVLAGAQVDDLVLLHGVDEQTGVYLVAPWNLARVSAVVPRVPKWS